MTTFDSTPANLNGWNNTPVTVNWTCADALSGPVKDADSYTLSHEGANLGIAPGLARIAPAIWDRPRNELSTST